MGELRERCKEVTSWAFMKKYSSSQILRLSELGDNLGCMYGVEPSYDKLLQLTLYKELISAKFNVELKYISGGTSITLPLIEQGAVPKDMNHFRIGEAAFFGISPLYNEQFIGLNTDTFEFTANIIELEEKKMVPEGIISDANIGHTADYTENDIGDTTVKAILDFGLLDVDKEDIECQDKDLSFVGITSDMIVVDLGTNRSKDGKIKYNIGDKVHFTPNYMGVARLLNSKFIDKTFI